MNWAGNLYLLAVAWPLARTDIREHRLPNKYTLPAIAIAFTAELIAAAITDQWFSFLVALICGVAGFGFATLGMGDVKLITAICLCLGWFSPIAPIMAISFAFVIAGVVVLAKLAFQKTRMGQSIALGPYLLIGFVIALVMSC